MSTIPLIFNEKQITYTLLGGTDQKSKNPLDVSILLLNRTPSQFRSIVLDRLVQKNFKNIISVEKNTGSFNLEKLSRSYPFVQFLVTQEEASVGELINLGMSVAQTKFVLVLWDDVCSNLTVTNNLLERLVELDVFCVTPRLVSSNNQNLPVRFFPTADRANFCVGTNTRIMDGVPTLYAGDWCGLYKRETFMKLIGADYTIESPYWQRLDFFFRSWLWGEKTMLCSSFSLIYSGTIPVEDTTQDMSYISFYLKNLLPYRKADHAVILKRNYFSFKRRTKLGFTKSRELFKQARKWTEKNKYCFKMDAQMLIEKWEK